MPPIRPRERRERRLDARGGVGRAGRIARTHGVVEPGDLILTGFDHGAQQRQRIGERAQLVERNAVFRARNVREIDAERIIPLPALDVGWRLRRQRLLRPKPTVRRYARDRVTRGGGEALEHARRQRCLDSILRHERNPLVWRVAI
jgi:hypothetical protein